MHAHKMDVNAVYEFEHTLDTVEIGSTHQLCPVVFDSKLLNFLDLRQFHHHQLAKAVWQ